MGGAACHAASLSTPSSAMSDVARTMRTSIDVVGAAVCAGAAGVDPGITGAGVPGKITVESAAAFVVESAAVGPGSAAAYDARHSMSSTGTASLMVASRAKDGRLHHA